MLKVYKQINSITGANGGGSSTVATYNRYSTAKQETGQSNLSGSSNSSTTPSEFSYQEAVGPELNSCVAEADLAGSMYAISGSGSCEGLFYN